MPPTQSRIRALPSDVISKIKSSTSIVHLTGVISELVKNSLDANARTIFITVDFRRGGCIVEDDGNGILPDEFEATGGLGKAHHTSKSQLNDSYGNRGLFLASLASLSLLTVTSRHIQHESTNSIIFHHSTPLARLIPAPPHQVLRFPGHGTSVTVNDLFGNMPVRVRSRALSLQRPDELEREWDNLRNVLVSLMLANSRLTKLVLVEVDKNKRISIRLRTALMQATDICHHHTDFSLDRIQSIFTQSGLITPQSLDLWHEISASISDLTVHAAISLQPCPTRKSQFISLGKDPVLSRNGSNFLYSEVNRAFALSDFSGVGIISDGGSVPNPESSVNRHDASSTASTRSWAKPLNRWPMFYIRIDAKDIQHIDDGSEHLPESDKSIQRMVDVLLAMIREFLKQHNLRPRDGKQQPLPSDRIQSICSIDSQVIGRSRGSLKQGVSVQSTEEAFSGHLKIPSLSRSQSANTGQSFTNWSRVKTAKDLNSNPTAPRGPRHPHYASDPIKWNSSMPITSSSWSDKLGLDTGPNTLRESHKKSDGENSIRTEGSPGGSSTDKPMTWIDPHTKMAYSINPRTGQTINSRKSLGTHRVESESSSSKDSAQNLWMENVLHAWENPTFSRTEMPISTMGAESAGQQAAHTSSHDCFKGIDSLDTAEVAKFRGKLRRCALETAEVIAQVDKKFILAKIRSTSSNSMLGGTSNDVLLLIDQHAADERCRVEQLLSDMFVPLEPTKTSQLGSQVRIVRIGSLVFEVSSTEGRLFQKYMDFFSTWGVGYETEPKNGSTVLISVHTLPALIAERCRLDPRLLIDLMRREMWSSEEEGRKPFQSNKSLEIDDADDNLVLSRIDDSCRSSAFASWVQQMNGCPQGIVDLLNSRACRTAIMFNDPLSVEECQALVSRLARCAFPFQCAHGRPSIIPIVDLRSLPERAVSLPLDLDARNSDHYYHGGMDVGFLEAFRRHYVQKSV